MTESANRLGPLGNRGRRRTLRAFAALGAVAAGASLAGTRRTAKAAANTRRIENFGVPWEASYGYAQAIQVGDTIYLSGQLSHDEDGSFVAPAPLDENGQVTGFDAMGAQLTQTYENCRTLLARFGAGMDDAVEEVVYVLDMESAFAAIPEVRRAVWGKVPVIASTILETPRLALPPQLCEIKMIAQV
jgi:enamine deaminase RidA (YjgF/YER057c/UK114 family)